MFHYFYWVEVKWYFKYPMWLAIFVWANTYLYDDEGNFRAGHVNNYNINHYLNIEWQLPDLEEEYGDDDWDGNWWNFSESG